MSTEYVIVLPYPASLNSYYGIVCNGRVPHKYVKERGRLYREEVIKIIKEQDLELRANVNLSLNVILTPPDNRIRDIDGPLKCLLDALTHSNVIEDDSFIRKLTVEFEEKEHYEKPGSVLLRLKSL